MSKKQQEIQHDVTMTPTNIFFYYIPLVCFLSSFSTLCDPFPPRFPEM